MSRIFAFISKINSILLLLMLLGVAALFAWGSWTSNQSQRRGAIEVAGAEEQTNSPMLLRLEDIENIAGANTQMMRLSAKEKSGKLNSSYSNGSEARNILFISGHAKKAHWLFPKQNNIILMAKQLRENSDNTKEPTKALYFEYVSKDSDGDGKLTNFDRSNIALSKPDGTGLVEILNGVERTLSYSIQDDQISVIYQVGKVIRHAHFSVLSLAKEGDQEIARLPDQI